MISQTTARFWKTFEQLPDPVQQAARKAYQLWKQDPYHPSLHFKQVHSIKLIYSVRISREWRAVGFKEGDYIIWFWIGSHADYDNLLSQL
ncbi:MAG: hypothetical protein AB1861_02085 [Cyanobacteriota bacterium]